MSRSPSSSRSSTTAERVPREPIIVSRPAASHLQPRAEAPASRQTPQKNCPRSGPLQSSVNQTCSVSPLERGSTPTRNSLGRKCRRSEEHTSELQSQSNLVCRLLLEKKKI